MGFLTVIFLLSHIFLSISITSAQCNNAAGNFTTNSTYSKNRNLILSSLLSNITANDGFYNTTIGQEPNKVYALALCKGDSSPTSCYSCINSTAQDLISKCPVQNEAFSWGVNDFCIVRYANRSFFGVLEQDPGIAVFSGDYPWDGDFYQIWSSLLDRLFRKASMGSSRLKFATGEEKLTNFQNIYGLAQCTPDLSQTDCMSCLTNSAVWYETCCRGKGGGFGQKMNCMFQWELYPFYATATDAPPPSPPPQSRRPPPSSTPPLPIKGMSISPY